MFDLILGLAADDLDLLRWLVAHRAMVEATIAAEAAEIEIPEALDLAEAEPDGSGMSVDDAIAWVQAVTIDLAALPPPVKKDDVGFSAATDAFLRNYLGHLRSGAELPIEAHLGAIDALRVHSNTQLDRAEWQAAYDALQAATPVPAAVARKYVTGAEAGATADKGTLKDDGSYRYDAQSDRILIQDMPFRRKFSLKTAEIERAGFVRGRDFFWQKTGGRDREGRDKWALAIAPAAVERFATWIEGAFPELAAAFRVHGATWTARSAARAPVEPPNRAATAAAAASQPPTPPPVLDPRNGQARGLAWRWSPGEPDVRILFPDKAAAFAGSAAAPMRTAYESSDTGTIFWRAFPARSIGAVSAAIRGAGYGAAADVLDVLTPAWQAQSAPALSEDAIREIRMLARRFRHTMDAGIPLETVEAALVEAAPYLLRVDPTVLTADLGPFGAFDVVQDKGYLRVSLPWDPAEKLAKKFNARKWGDPKRARMSQIGLDLKRAPDVARALDAIGYMPLAMAIRLVLLTAASTRPGVDCSALEEVASALTIDAIPDVGTRRQCAEIVGRIRWPGPRPFPYQDVGIAFAAMSGYRCLIGDAMGLGKTMQAIGAILTDRAGNLPALVVAPASVVGVWAGEIAKFATGLLQCVVVRDVRQLGAMPRPAVYVVSWDGLRSMISTLSSIPWKLLVLDESHKAKHPGSARSKAAAELALKIPRLLELSGTAMENRPGDLWHQLFMLDPGSWPTRKAFMARIGAKQHEIVTASGAVIKVYDDLFRMRKPEGPTSIEDVPDRYIGAEIDTDESSGKEPAAADSDMPWEVLQAILERLRDDLRCFMVRRLKSEVMKDLPPKLRLTMPIDMTPAERKTYRAVEEELERWYIETWHANAIDHALDLMDAGATLQEAVDATNKTAGDPAFAQEAIARLGRLREIAGRIKIPYVIEWILDFLPSGESLLVFCEHLEVWDAIANALTEAKVPWGGIKGAITGPKRDQAVADFQAGRSRVFVTTKAGAEGITLTRASVCLFTELWWVPYQMEQAEDRIHRFGQRTDRSVRIVYPVLTGTVDDVVAESIADKRNIIETVMGGEATEGGHEDAREAGAATGVRTAILNSITTKLGGRATMRITATEVMAARAAGS